MHYRFRVSFLRENDSPCRNYKSGPLTIVGVGSATHTGSPAAGNTTLTVSLRWDGDQLLFTSDQNGHQGVKIGLLGDLFNSTQEPIQVIDRDWTGVAVSGHTLYGSTWQSEGDSIRDPYGQNGGDPNANYPDSTSLQGTIVQPASDGIWDRYNVFQGARAYHPHVGAWMSPAALQARLMTQRRKPDTPGIATTRPISLTHLVLKRRSKSRTQT